ncbi:MAG: hypothetical protein RQ966_10910 [Acetobacteraceae bacterium]|nr:hypothetical protein [Acetobacteraceae bacterium]
MRKYLFLAAGLTLLTGTGVALAQNAPGGPDGGPDQHRERWGMMHRPMRGPDQAAFFRFRRGDAEIDIKCPASENLQSCVGAAGALMDKVSGMQQPKTQ